MTADPEQCGSQGPDPFAVRNPNMTFDSSWCFASWDSNNHGLKTVLSVCNWESAVGKVKVTVFGLLVVESADTKLLNTKV